MQGFTGHPQAFLCLFILREDLKSLEREQRDYVRRMGTYDLGELREEFLNTSYHRSL